MKAEKELPTLKNKKEEKLDLILREAALLFREKGFGGSSMRDLAERVGMEAASLYYHIGSKEEILEKICFDIACTYISHLEEIEISDESYVDRLKSLIRLHVRMMITHGPEVSVTNHDWKYLKGEKRSEFEALRKLYENRLTKLVDEGMAAGELIAVNAKVAVFTMLSSLRWIEYWWKPQKGISSKELENTIIILLLGGLAQHTS